MAIETLQFTVIKKQKPFELRSYSAFISAQVEVEGEDFREAANRGFGPLANYIFGDNTSADKIKMTAPVMAKSSNEKIAMTSPVTVSRERNYQVSFVMPSKYTLDNLPIPGDSRVKFIEHPTQTMAVIRFSGPFTQPNFMKHLNKLREWIEAENLTPASEPIFAGYDPPFTPWFLKHNEIMVKVKEPKGK
jgi:effector-binding domain-containing protein